MDKRDLLTIFDLSRDEASYIVDRGAALKEMLNKGVTHAPLAGKSVALIFEKASTRTRISFEVGVHQLGGQPLVVLAKDSQMGRGEPIQDTARVYSRFVHCIMLRTYAQTTLEGLASNGSIPVINGLSDMYHPCQVLSDLLTCREETGKGLGDLSYAWIGDGNNMCHSWIAAAGVLGLDLRMACPATHMPSAAVVARAQGLGAKLLITEDPAEAVAGADVVNTDVWASMGQESEASARKEVFAPYQVDSELMAKASAGAIFLHCLPAHRGEEVSEGVFESPASRVFAQAENRLHVQKAILELVVTGKV